MKIDKNLNLTFVVGEIPVFHTPISKALFEQHCLLLAEFQANTASSYARHNRIAKSLFCSFFSFQNEVTGVYELAKKADLFLKDLTRTTFFHIAGKDSPVGFETALKEGLIDEYDADEVLSQLIFFTETRWIIAANYQRMIEILTDRNCFLQSLSLMDWRNSLLTVKDSETTPIAG